MSTPQAGDIFQPGDLLNNTYRILSILGRGGTSEVYEARSEVSGRVIAIKALRSEYANNADFLSLMTREEEIRDVRHDAVVRYYDTQRMLNGVVYLVMDYVEGVGLDQKMREGGVEAADLLIIGRRVCEGLIAAHERRIVHRDLSPDNIILRGSNPAEAVIIDFGIAKDTNPGAATIVGNEFAGKYAYAAPEQLRGFSDARTDIYSLGALLLAVFRGKKPDVGKNPVDVVQNKSKPLDVEGVPEPLKSLIARMTDPEPDRRFQSAQDLLAAFRSASAGRSAAPAAAGPLEDATVIAPRVTAGKETATRAPRTTAAKDEGRKGSRILLPAGLALVVAAGTGGYFGGFFEGLLGPSYPLADPFTLTVEKAPNASPHAAGNVPSPEMNAALSDRMAALGGNAELSVATGNLAETWSDDVLRAVDAVSGLDEYRVALSNNSIEVSGLAKNRDDLAAAQSDVAALLSGGPLSGTADLRLGPRFLPPADLAPLLETYADCGRLRLLAPPVAGYGFDDRIIVSGTFSSTESRDGLRDAIGAIAGNRSVSVDAELLNPALCEIDAVLPQATPGGFDVHFGFGDRPDPNPSGTYVVGDNPVIDVKLPDEVQDGYLWISIVDVQGIVFHLLPNIARPDNSIASLRSDATDGYIRVAYPLSDASDRSRLAFKVDGSVLGKSKIVVVHSETPLFDELRPTTESAQSFAEAIQEVRNSGGLSVASLDTAMLVTTER
ncbi:serine/threonine protein kinase [Ostreiculturibacter nitratireducens]|uniref:serine/threonine protein kinase n=1 Tax=Ostreiculturibacter nitratireducens TaxID=3075226 RepID=UPI0031B6026A